MLAISAFNNCPAAGAQNLESEQLDNQLLEPAPVPSARPAQPAHAQALRPQAAPPLPSVPQGGRCAACQGQAGQDAGGAGAGGARAGDGHVGGGRKGPLASGEILRGRAQRLSLVQFMESCWHWSRGCRAPVGIVRAQGQALFKVCKTS